MYRLHVPIESNIDGIQNGSERKNLDTLTVRKDKKRPKWVQEDAGLETCKDR